MFVPIDLVLEAADMSVPTATTFECGLEVVAGFPTSIL